MNSPCVPKIGSLKSPVEDVVAAGSPVVTLGGPSKPETSS